MTNTSNIITLTSPYQDGLLLGNFILWVKKVQKWKTNAYYLHRILFLMSDSHIPGQEPAEIDSFWKSQNIFLFSNYLATCNFNNF